MTALILARGSEAALFVVAIFVAILLVEMAVAIVVLATIDLVAGAGMLLLFRKKRHLFWTLPLLNTLCWFLIGQFCLWLPDSGAQLNEFNDWAINIADWLMHPLAFVVGLLTAGMLTPVQLAAARVAAGGKADAAAVLDAANRAAPDPSTPAAQPETSTGENLAVAAVGRWASFREGFFAPWDGLAFMWRNRELWKFGIAPVVINVLITGVVLVLLTVVVGYSINWLHPRFGPEWWWRALEVVCGIALLALALLGAFVSWLLLQGILCGFFYGKLAVQVELKLGMNPDDIRDVSLLHQTADAIRDVTLLLAINAGLLVLHVVPVIGSLAAAAGTIYFDWMIIGGDFLNFPLDLRGMRRAEKRAFARKFRCHTLGLGAAVMLLLLIPVVGAVLLTTAVAGSVLLHRRLELVEN